MKNRRKYPLFIRSTLLVIILIVLIFTVAVSLFFYMFSIPEPKALGGLSTTYWPRDFTNSFTVWTDYEDGQLTIEETGLERLDEYGLWIQFIDESGREIFSHNKPSGYPSEYSASELLALDTSQYADGYTIFVNSLDNTDETCSYIIGFPFDIGKHLLYYNGARIAHLSPVVRLTFLFVSGILAASIFVYSLLLSRRLAKVTGGIRKLSDRTYSPLKEKSVFGEIYALLNQMDLDLRHADKVSEETERTRQEWITNITHDLKTPLAPIKGYAELLADGPARDPGEVREYGSIMLKNVDHAEKLINDLKLTYQLEADTIPYHLQKVRITCWVKEWVIDIINDPAFSDRDIDFESSDPGLAVCMDPDLFCRAVQNLIINALTHNPADTKIWVTVSQISDRICISVRDNGNGISDADQAALFDRYYRGTNTKEKPESSGLGLAIAKQIVNLHGGDISVRSQINVGTEFIISLPAVD